MKKPMVTLIVLALAVSALAQSEPLLGEIAFRQALRDVGTDLRLLCVAAHPDDEDDATLALYRMAYGVETHALIATRGEGGQNEIGPELGNELGVIRTREMQAAARVIGAELHFLDLPEFGYSKSIEETYSVWGEEEALRRLVLSIRQIRPDIIITHHGKQKDHGHHQAIGQTLIKAFDTAADPNAFPEQLTGGVEPWQTARLYIRRFEQTSDAVVVPIGAFDALRGIPYNEIAARALEEHTSQGMGFFIDRLRAMQQAWYVLEKESASGISGAGEVLAPEASLLSGLRDRVTPQARELSAALHSLTRADALVAFSAHADDAEWQRLAAAAIEASLTASVSDTEVVPGQAVTVTATLADFGATDLTEATARIESAPGFHLATPPAAPMALNNGRAGAAFALTIPNDARFTVPAAEHLFDTGALDPQFFVVVEATVAGAPVRLSAPVRVEIAPPIEIQFLDAPYLARHNVDASVQITMALTNHRPEAGTAAVSLSVAPGLAVDAAQQSFPLATEGAEHLWAVPAAIGNDPVLQPREYRLAAVVEGSGEARHAAVHLVDLAIPENVRVGVIQGYDDTFMTVLRKMGVPHEALETKDFSAATLDTFTTIIVDMRAYMVRPDLVANNQALLDYVHRGAKVIVNYHKTFEWKPEFAPYPIRLSRNRVTEENAPVTHLVPDHSLLNTPNAITARDWEGWTQERGLYFPDEWDEHYTALLAMADTGETIPPGSLLVATYGEGRYVYTALALYRQLRQLHPGALRLFANML
jgi:LmbE family N-acetylglucosaminyl deacetylase